MYKSHGAATLFMGSGVVISLNLIIFLLTHEPNPRVHELWALEAGATEPASASPSLGRSDQTVRFDKQLGLSLSAQSPRSQPRSADPRCDDRATYRIADEHSEDDNDNDSDHDDYVDDGVADGHGQDDDDFDIDYGRQSEVDMSVRSGKYGKLVEDEVDG